MHILARREILHLFQERIERGRLGRKLLVVPRRRRVSGQRQLVRQIHAGPRRSRGDGKVEDLAEQHHSIQVDVLFVFQNVSQHRGSCCPITLAEQKLRRIPPAVLHQKARDESRERLRILIHAPERLVRILAGKPPKTCPGHIDKNFVAHVQQTVRVVDQLVGSTRQMRVTGRLHILRPQRSHVQPHRRAAWPAVIEERDRPILGIRACLEIGHVKHVRHWRRIGRLLRRAQRKLRARQRLAIRPKLRIVGVGRAHRDGACNRRVRNMLPARIDRALRGRVGRWRRRGSFRALLCGAIGIRGRFFVLRAKSWRHSKHWHN